MNMDNLDQGTLDQNVAQFGQPPKRGWWSRNWLWFVPTVLLVLVVFCCGCPLGFAFWAFGRMYDMPPLNDAMQKIQSNETLTKELGQPIKPAYWPPPQFQPADREMDIRWEIQGPNGQARAHLKTRMMNGQWEPVTLEVILADNRKISIAEEGGNEAAPFVPTKPEEKKPEGNSPPPEINLPAPDAQTPDKT
jgi:hypothetical protein